MSFSDALKPVYMQINIEQSSQLNNVTQICTTSLIMCSKQDPIPKFWIFFARIKIWLRLELLVGVVVRFSQKPIIWFQKQFSPTKTFA